MIFLFICLFYHNSRKTPKGVVLTVIDGFGESAWPEGNGIESSQMPFLDYLKSKYLYQSLISSRQPVGLTKDEPGSSAVGHQTLGLGRTTPSYFQILEKSLNKRAPESMVKNKRLREAFHTAKRAHFVGLCTDEGIFSHPRFLPPMFEAALIENVSEVFVHCILTTLIDKPSTYLKKIEDLFPPNLSIRISAVYSGETAMDKMRNWNLTKIAYDGMTDHLKTKKMSRKKTFKYLDSIQKIVPEFDPICIQKSKEIDSCVDSVMKENDVVVFFHFREDKSYQLAKALIDGLPNSKNPKLRVLPLILYDRSLTDTEPIIPAIKYNNSLAAWISKKGFKQLRVAEEYKRSHATIFFSGGILQPIFKGEDRQTHFESVPEKSVDLFPKMNATLVANAAVNGIRSNQYKLIFVNFANVDATGHTGNLTAVRIAANFVDRKLRQIFEECQKNDYVLFITSDHGNGEELIELNGDAQLFHTLNNVPLVIASSEYEFIPMRIGKAPYIGNVAASVLTVLDIDAPKEMEPSLLRPATKSTLATCEFGAQQLLIGYALGMLTCILAAFLYRILKNKICLVPLSAKLERRDSWNHPTLPV